MNENKRKICVTIKQYMGYLEVNAILILLVQGMAEGKKIISTTHSL